MCPLSANPVSFTSEPSATSLPALTQDMAKSAAVSLVGSHLDYANSLLYGTSQGNLHKLQRIQNTLAKLVCPGHTHSSDALRFLHWLPVRQHIDFKIASLTFKLLNFGSPAYLSCLLKPYLPVRALHFMDSSSWQGLMSKPASAQGPLLPPLESLLPLYGIPCPFMSDYLPMFLNENSRHIFHNEELAPSSGGSRN